MSAGTSGLARQVAIVVNGEPLATSQMTLADLVESLGHGAASVATAMNGTFVPRAQRASTPLHDGDRIEIVAPRQGG